MPIFANDFAPEVVVGQKVAYVPGPAHYLDRDQRGDHVFEFVHAKSHRGSEAGQVVQMQHVGMMTRRTPEGHFETGGGHTIRPTRPQAHWSAVVTFVHGDGLVDLDIQHPLGHRLGYFKIPYAADGGLHTWHPEGA